MSANSPYRRPSRRPLRIFALDPMRIDRGSAHGMVTPRATLFIPYEEHMKPGPRGKRLRVIDYDGAHRRYYTPIDLDHRDVLIRDGLPPSETDPRFHQQMVYAVVAKLWADVEAALGRRITFGRTERLTLFPHAFYGRNAYYDPSTSAILFGYFQASAADSTGNLPGQMVYTCLSHDIIVHESTHALVDRLRPRFIADTNPDVAAFHEGFADLIAIFQHFKLREVLVPALTDTQGRIGEAEGLLGLARQFGYSTGGRGPLRSAQPGAAGPDPSEYRNSLDAHDRGAVLVRAVFDAFLSLYDQRTVDLIRLASGGTGVLPKGALHPDLVERLAREASELAEEMFTMLIRSFDYLPPLDVTFEDFLRALVTLDVSLSPSDESTRVALIEGFRRHGIYPTSAGSLDDAAVAWGGPAEPIDDFPVERALLHDVIADLDQAEPEGFAGDNHDEARWAGWTTRLEEFARRRHGALALHPEHPIHINGHVAVRRRADGRPTVDLVACFVQERPDLPVDDFVPAAGCTVVADSAGRVRYAITKVLTDDAAVAAPALGAIGLRLRSSRLADAGEPYRRHRAEDARLRVNFALLHSAHDREGDG